ncbi:DUF349 domain-containing protein [Porphyromonas asaccharolytica]|uniref:DUF349 domain-containing protein n=1 Tax=Porphyromonas asaccharolytica (strain ATCC 25260 / DSM 20707 / BCRC 10618 / CCUG 7834 / JCM 6326 / LMG 13178 / VPI 4198 / B440) TaxID=879243 RepID=F4KL01_PORAD|nr:DUF349 domain-containing protein [Porphyromonas asaccharolytica]AEE13013.1 protein of unknown function DUF349 [Porphyromonas asaccharolytica DSM 20707]
MNLIPQEENNTEQTSALDQTTTTPSTQEATTSQANTPETSPSPEAVAETTPEKSVATEETTETIQAETTAPAELSEEERQYQELLNKSDADIAKMSCAQITDDVVLLLQSGELPPRSIIDRYKNVFYSKMNSYLNTVSEENAKLRADAEAQEIRLKELLNDFKERNRKRQEEIAEEQKANLATKRDLVERLSKLLTSSESFSIISKEYREITESWRNTGAVPPGDMRQIQGEFEHLREQFYDLQQINNEFRDYDFKKNLEAKEAIIQRAKELAESTDVTQAARELQDLHHRWRDVGPVAKELRKDLWKQFQELSAKINNNNQEYRNQQRTQEGENEAIKRGIITQIEAINPNDIHTFKDWRTYTDQIKELQDQWRKTGRVPRAVSEELYLHFRTACDIFFDKRKEFMRDRNKLISEQGDRKRAIIEEIEQIVAEERWPEGHSRIQELQTEWNEMIHTNKHQALFKRFRAACDTYYTHHKALYQAQREESKESVATAKQLLARAHELAAIEAPSDADREEAVTLQRDFNQLGYMPRKTRRKLQDELKEQMDAFFNKLRASDKPRGDRRGNRNNNRRNFGPASPYGEEYDRIQRRKEQLESDLQTYSNNKERLSVTSRAGENLLKMLEERCDSMQREIDELDLKLRDIRKEQRAQQGADEPADAPEQSKEE